MRRSKHAVIGRHQGDPAVSALCGDNALAVNFAVRHEARLRYVAPWGCWMLWDGRCWRPDVARVAVELAREVCLHASMSAQRMLEPRFGRRLGLRLDNAAAAPAVAALASTDRRLAARPEQFDTDLDLVNTPAGIIDARTGASWPHRADAYMTRITSVAPAAPGTPCPLWWRFLDRVTGGDSELQSYLQRAAGYALTGHTGEHALFFLHGPGANGKSTFINTLAGVLGDYAVAVPMRVFARSSGRDADRLAGLASVRLLTAQETDDGRGWSEARIKSLTGGDPIPARFQGQEFFNFTPRFKLLFAGNQMPSLSRVDEAMRRRFHRIPFDVTIPAEERDPDLPRKLRDEWPAILRWAIDGAQRWRSTGLQTAAGVQRASERYLEAEDAFGQWCSECVQPSPDGWESSADLFASWRAWAAKAGETIGSRRRFAQLLEGGGFQPKRGRSGDRGFSGWILRGQQDADFWPNHDFVASNASNASNEVVADTGAEVAPSRCDLV